MARPWNGPATCWPSRRPARGSCTSSPISSRAAWPGAKSMRCPTTWSRTCTTWAGRRSTTSPSPRPAPSAPGCGPTSRPPIHVTRLQRRPVHGRTSCRSSCTLASGGRKIELNEQLKLEPGDVESLRLRPAAAGRGAVAGDGRHRDRGRPAARQHAARRPARLAAVPGAARRWPLVALARAGRDVLPGNVAAAGARGRARRRQPVSSRGTVALEDRLPNLDKFDVVVLADVGDLDRGDADAARRSGRSAAAGCSCLAAKTSPAERTAALAAAGLTGGQRRRHRSTPPTCRCGWERGTPSIRSSPPSAIRSSATWPGCRFPPARRSRRRPTRRCWPSSATASRP